jgi:hypothetical protein
MALQVPSHGTMFHREDKSSSARLVKRNGGAAAAMTVDSSRRRTLGMTASGWLTVDDPLQWQT